VKLPAARSGPYQLLAAGGSLLTSALKDRLARGGDGSSMDGPRVHFRRVAPVLRSPFSGASFTFRKMERPRLRANTALGVWFAGLILAVILAALSQRLDSSNRNKEDSRSRHMLMILAAESLIETLDKGDSDPEQLQEIIDKLDELNDNFYA
jgi:hypothetical protein